MRVFSRLRRSRRGDSTVVGAIFFIIIALLFTRFLFDIYQIQSEVNQKDLLRGQERFEISQTIFGQLITYTQADFSSPTINVGTGNPYTGLNSSASTGNTKPVSNMNFTGSGDGWTFTKSYFGTGSGSTGASGFWEAGTIVSKFSSNPPTGTTAGATMNWTTRFFIDVDRLGGASAITAVNLVWTRKALPVEGITGTASLDVFFKDPLAIEHSIQNVTVSAPDANAIISSVNLDRTWITNGGSGFYSLIIRINAELRHLGSSTPEFRVSFDDVGLNIVNTAQVSDWTASLSIAENPANVKNLKISYTGHFNTSTQQTISLFDFTTNNFVTLDSSFLSTTSVEISNSFSGNDVAPFISSTGEIRLQIGGLKSVPFRNFADAIVVEIIDAGSTPDKITITFSNPGGITVVVKRLWVIDSNGHFFFDDELILTPGVSVTITYTHLYSVGKITFRAITERGNIEALSTTAI